MKIVIDYSNVLPDEQLIITMEAFKKSVEEHLAPFQWAMDSSPGLLLIHTDASFELRGTPLPLARQLIAVLGATCES